MQYAIFSDIHHEAEALGAVLLDAARRNVDACLCLGDTGADQAVDLLRYNGVEAVFGNWEVSGWAHLAEANRQWTLALPPQRKYAGFWVAHAAPVWPDSISTLQKFLKNRAHISMSVGFPYYHTLSDGLWRGLTALLEAQTPVFFHGHTHRQGMWIFGPDNRLAQAAPVSRQLEPGYTYLIGVGSAGRPQDSNRPGYVVYDSNTRLVEFVRL